MKIKIIAVMAAFICLMAFSAAFADDNEKPVYIFTSQPNYDTMRVITADSRWQQIPVTNPESAESTFFVDAYKDFYNKTIEYITENAKKYNMDGACNLKIQYAATDKLYMFSATYDYWRYKK